MVLKNTCTEILAEKSLPKLTDVYWYRTVLCTLFVYTSTLGPHKKPEKIATFWF